MKPRFFTALPIILLFSVPSSWCLLIPDSDPTPPPTTTIADTSFIDPYHSHLLPLPTSFPTTLTTVWTTVTTTIVLPQGPMPVFYSADVTSSLTITTIEPWPTSPSSFPFTVVQTAVTVSNITSLVKLYGPTGPIDTFSFLTTVTTPSTFVLSSPGPAPTDLPLDAYPTTGAASWWWVFSTPQYPLPVNPSIPTPTPPATDPNAVVIPCGECPRAADWAPDPRCVAHGLDTACQGRQCGVRGGLWWCAKSEGLWKGVGEGRVCWGRNVSVPVGEEGGGLFAELLAPCKRWDHQVGCAPCEGADGEWMPDVWVDV